MALGDSGGPGPQGASDTCIFLKMTGTRPGRVSFLGSEERDEESLQDVLQQVPASTWEPANPSPCLAKGLCRCDPVKGLGMAAGWPSGYVRFKPAPLNSSDDEGDQRSQSPQPHRTASAAQELSVRRSQGPAPMAEVTMAPACENGLSTGCCSALKEGDPTPARGPAWGRSAR